MFQLPKGSFVNQLNQTSCLCLHCLFNNLVEPNVLVFKYSFDWFFSLLVIFTVKRRNRHDRMKFCYFFNINIKILERHVILYKQFDWSFSFTMLMKYVHYFWSWCCLEQTSRDVISVSSAAWYFGVRFCLCFMIQNQINQEQEAGAIDKCKNLKTCSYMKGGRRFGLTLYPVQQSVANTFDNLILYRDSNGCSLLCLQILLCRNLTKSPFVYWDV